MTQYQKPQDLAGILTENGPYPIEAFDFVRDGLSYTVQHLQNDARLDESDRHITGQELCLGLRDFAIDRYGLLAPAVLSSWHIARTDDFGRIVFAMIDAGLMMRTEEDSIEDFRSVYNFEEAFAREDLVARIGPN